MESPYEEYKIDPLWQVIGDCLSDLHSNGDIEEKTDREYIVGYLTKKLRIYLGEGE